MGRALVDCVLSGGDMVDSVLKKRLQPWSKNVLVIVAQHEGVWTDQHKYFFVTKSKYRGKLSAKPVLVAMYAAAHSVLEIQSCCIIFFPGVIST